MNTTPTPTDKAVESVADAIAEAVGKLSIAMGGIVINTEAIKVVNAMIITQLIVAHLKSELVASRELCRQYKEVAEELKYSIETEFGAFSIPCRGTLSKLEALNQSVKDAEI